MSAAEVADRANQIRQLIALAEQQLDKAKNDLGVARVGLAELESRLLTGGLEQ